MLTKKRETKQIPLEWINIGDRVREDLGDINSLMWSMDQLGQLQPVVVEKRTDGRYDLRIGERRIRAAIQLNWDVIDAITVEQLTPEERLEMELEENLRRKDFSWQEEVRGIRQLHTMKEKKFLSQRTFPGKWDQAKTAEELGISAAKVSIDLAIATALDQFPDLAKCSTKREARRLLRKLNRGGGVHHESEYLIKVKECFLYAPPLDGMAELERGTVDLLLTDVTEFLDEKVFRRMYEVLSPTSHGFLFFPLEKHGRVLELLKECKIRHRERPFLWHVRTEDSYQTYLWISKNLGSPPKYVQDHTSHKRDEKSLHTLDKPNSLLSNIIQHSTVKGHFVLDPICYGTNFTKACLELNRVCRSYCPSRVVWEQSVLQMEDSGEGILKERGEEDE